MTWYPNHPGGVMVCDHPGCTRQRRNYCSPTERDQWRVIDGQPIRDLCPNHAEVEP